jgi:hypothetical protein
MPAMVRMNIDETLEQVGLLRGLREIGHDFDAGSLGSTQQVALGL